MKRLHLLFAAIAAGLMPAVHAMRLMPDPALSAKDVHAYLATRIAQPATLGEVTLSERRVTPLTANLACNIELVLGQNFYVSVPRSDDIFAAVTDRLNELDQAQHQLSLVPKEFIASLGGQKSSAGLAFLQHTFVRTTVPAGSKARIERTVLATHNGRFIGGAWNFDGPPLAITAWSGRPLHQFSNPLPVDTPDFARQLEAFLETAKRTLDEVDDISTRYLAKVDGDREALFRKLPVGAVLAVKDEAAPATPLFLEVKAADQRTGRVDFLVTSSYVSQPSRTVFLRGIDPDPAADLREILARQHQVEAEPAPPSPPVADTPATTTASVVQMPSARQLLQNAAQVQISLDSGAPVLRVARVPQAVQLERIPEDRIDAERMRFQTEKAALLAATDTGRVYRGSLGDQAYLLGILNADTATRIVLLQRDADDMRPTALEASLQEVEREHPALQVRDRNRPRVLPSQYATMEITRQAATLALTGSFGTAEFQLAPEKRIRPSTRIVSADMAEFLEALVQNRAGVYRHLESRFIPLPAATAPEQSGGGAFGNALINIGTLGLGSLPTVTLQFPIASAVTRIKRDTPLYGLHVNSRMHALPLARSKSTYNFVAARSGRGYAPRASDLTELPARELDDGVHAFSAAGLRDDNVFALVQNESDGVKYYLVQFEP